MGNVKEKCPNENNIVLQDNQEATKETKKPAEEEVPIAETSEYLPRNQTGIIWNNWSRQIQKPKAKPADEDIELLE